MTIVGDILRMSPTMIHEMEGTLNKLAADIQTVDSAYSSAKGRNYIRFSENGTGLAERIGLVRSLLLAALVLMAAFTCVLLGKYLSDKEKEA